MTIKPIRNDDDLRAAFHRLETIFQAEEGTPEAEEMELLVTLIEAYENRHYPIGPADPVEAIKFRMEQQGLTPRDLEQYIGSSGRVSEVLNRKMPLSLRMVKRLHDGLRIPYESLLSRIARKLAHRILPETPEKHPQCSPPAANTSSRLAAFKHPQRPGFQLCRLGLIQPGLHPLRQRPKPPSQ